MKGTSKILIGIISIISMLFLVTVGYAPTSETGSTTLNASVIVFVDIAPSTQLVEGIFFGEVDMATVGNPAQNNTNCDGGTCYNITNDPGSNVDIDLYHDLTASLGTGIYVNESASITAADSGFSTNTTVDVDPTYTIIGNTTVNCTSIAGSDNCWIMYYLDVASGASGGTKSTTYEYCGVEEGQGSGTCT